MKNKITFILPVLSQPRFHKRINFFKQKKFHINIFSFERDYFKGNSESLEFISLGKIKNKRYWMRIIRFIRSYKILRTHKEKIFESKIVYVFSLDLAFYIMFFLKFMYRKNNIKIVYEVADVRSIMLGNRFINKLVRLIERYVIKNVQLVTVTSPYFLTEYYQKIQQLPKQNFFVLENKLVSQVPKRKDKEIWNGNRPLVIGFIGLLRCRITWSILYELAMNYPDKYIIYIRGYVLDLPNFHDEIQGVTNIIYEGEFKSPEDLADIYSKIDISWIGNISDNNQNVEWALPNRLYESLYYRVPMIAHINSGVGERVNSFKSGWSFDFFNKEDIFNKLSLIDKAEYKKVYENININDDFIFVERDHEELIKLLLK